MRLELIEFVTSDVFLTDFNSIKVRLELEELSANLGRSVNFNSIKVRLELVFYCTPFDSMKNFNSIKVRLEHEVCIQGERGELFQFHKGAIRTVCQ